MSNTCSTVCPGGCHVRCHIQRLGGAHSQRPQAAGGEHPAVRTSQVVGHLRQPGNRLDGHRMDRGTPPARRPKHVLLRDRYPPENWPARTAQGQHRLRRQGQRDRRLPPGSDDQPPAPRAQRVPLRATLDRPVHVRHAAATCSIKRARRIRLGPVPHHRQAGGRPRWTARNTSEHCTSEGSATPMNWPNGGRVWHPSAGDAGVDLLRSRVDKPHIAVALAAAEWTPDRASRSISSGDKITLVQAVRHAGRRSADLGHRSLRCACRRRWRRRVALRP